MPHAHRSPRGAWQVLLGHALRLIDEVRKRGTARPFWTLGGGTALMLRYHHRLSKDIDIFVPDPQYLGFVTPRLSEVAEEIASDYVEGARFVKLIRPEGEIDFVVSANLTDKPFDNRRLQGRTVRLESGVEIVAKKLWYRGDCAMARDLFDLSLVIEREPRALASAAPFLVSHRDSFIAQLHERSAILKMQFEAIDTLDYRPGFEAAVHRAERFLRSLPLKTVEPYLSTAGSASRLRRRNSSSLSRMRISSPRGTGS